MVGNASSGNHGSKDYGLLLYMRSELVQAHAQLMANRQLTRSNAGLLALTEGLHELGCLDKDAYEACKELYSHKMVFSLVAERHRPKTVDGVQEQTRLKKMEVDFSQVISQWSSMPTKARLFWGNKAKDFKDKVPNAAIVLELASTAGDAKQEVLAGGP